MRFYAFLLLAAFSSIVCAQDMDTSTKKPKNVVLMIGDGMGLSQVSAGFYFNDGTSNFERFQTIGLIKTSSSAELITDSAAGATAFASGVKTYNGAIGFTPKDGAVPTLVEIISEDGMNTGIISTSSVVHATPACFYAHSYNRREYFYIAEFLPKSELDFVAGGGTKFFTGRSDGKDLYMELEKNGFKVYADSLVPNTSDKKPVYLLAEDGMPKMIDGRGDFLPNSTTMAIESLNTGDNGFFLMIEGSQIDWGGHANDTDYLVGEQLDFDKTLGKVLDFAKSDGETLVIVTADHETGGFTLSPDADDYNKIKGTFATGGHSATLIPVFAYGPGEDSFKGIYENTEIFHKIMALLK